MSQDAAVSSSRALAILAAYGGAPARWPDAERAAMMRAVMADPQLRAAVAEARALDAALDAAALEASVDVQLSDAAVRRALEGAPRFWPAAARLASALAACALVGLGFGFGAGQRLTAEAQAEAALDATFFETIDYGSER